MGAQLLHARGKRRPETRRNPQHQQYAVADHGHQGQLRPGRPMGLRGLVRPFAKPAQEQMAGAGRSQGAGAVPGTVAGCRSGQWLPDLQRADQPLLHAADRGAVPFHHPGLDRPGQEPLRGLVPHPQQHRTVPSAGRRGRFRRRGRVRQPVFRTEGRSALARWQLLRPAQRRRGRLARPLRARRGIQRAGVLAADAHRCGTLRQIRIRRQLVGQRHLCAGLRIPPFQDTVVARLAGHGLPRTRSCLPLCRRQRLQFQRNGLLPVPPR